MSPNDLVFNDRELLWQQLRENPSKQWDMVIVGGGITGAGVLREAARRNLKVLLIEQRDFAWGTSSRSSKMVHGGLRYIAQGDIKLTQHSLQERERLLKEAPGLIERMGYYFPLRKGQFPGRIIFSTLLALYDKLAGIKDHRYFDRKALIEKYPDLNEAGLKGACYYTDTVVDDARLVLRVLQEAINAGGNVLNYIKAQNLIKTGDEVSGLVLENVENGEIVKVKASVVVNATGAWADKLRNELNSEKRVRPLRGSHMLLPSKLLPLKDALTLFHPKDKRPVFVFPWEGTTVVGTTDLDHKQPLDEEASITEDEVEYLLDVLRHQFPRVPITREDIISTYAGVRPVIGSEKSKDPSKERRDHAVWSDNGLITVSGGKLTTFRLIALDTISAAQIWLNESKSKTSTETSTNTSNLSDSKVTDTRIFETPEVLESDSAWMKRLLGRYGKHARTLLAEAPTLEQNRIEETDFSLAECRWAAKHESVIHLDDLLLRRTRLGSLLINGGECIFLEIKTICEQELGWNNDRWEQELARYLSIWKKHYYLPEPAKAHANDVASKVVAA